jgi:hypothetical protein
LKRKKEQKKIKKRGTKKKNKSSCHLSDSSMEAVQVRLKRVDEWNMAEDVLLDVSSFPSFEKLKESVARQCKFVHPDSFVLARYRDGKLAKLDDIPNFVPFEELFVFPLVFWANLLSNRSLTEKRRDVLLNGAHCGNFFAFVETRDSATSFAFKGACLANRASYLGLKIDYAVDAYGEDSHFYAIADQLQKLNIANETPNSVRSKAEQWIRHHSRQDSSLKEHFGIIRDSASDEESSLLAAVCDVYQVGIGLVSSSQQSQYGWLRVMLPYGKGLSDNVPKIWLGNDSEQHYWSLVDGFTDSTEFDAVLQKSVDVEDAKKVEGLLQQGANASKVDLSKCQNEKLVRLLVGKGADPSSALPYFAEKLQKLSMTKFLVERGARADAVDLFKLFYCHDILDILFECEGIDRAIFKVLRSVEKGDVASLRKVKDKSLFSRIDIGYICEKGYMDMLKFLVEECGVSVKGMDLKQHVNLAKKWEFVLYLLNQGADPDIRFAEACEDSQYEVARHFLKAASGSKIIGVQKDKEKRSLHFAKWLPIFESGISMQDFAVKSVWLENGRDFRELAKVAKNPTVFDALDKLEIALNLNRMNNESWLEVADLVTDSEIANSLKSCKISLDEDGFEKLCASDKEFRPLLKVCESIGLNVKISRRFLPKLVNHELINCLKDVRVIADENIGELKEGTSLSDLILSLSKIDFSEKLHDLVFREIKKMLSVGVSGPQYDSKGQIPPNFDSPESSPRPTVSPIVERKSRVKPPVNNSLGWTKTHIYFLLAFVGVVVAVSVGAFYFPVLKNDSSAIFMSHTLFGVKTDQGWLCPSSQTGLFLSNVSCLFHLEQSSLDSGTFVLGTNGKYVSAECFESRLCLNNLASATHFKIDPINHVLFVHLEDGWTTLAQLEQSRVGVSNGAGNKLRVAELFSYSDNLDWSSFEEVSGFVQQIYPGAAAFSTKRGSIGLSWRAVKEKFWKVVNDKDADSVLEFGIALLKCPVGFVRLEKSTYVTAENAEDISKCNIKAKVEEKATDLIVVIGTHVLSAAWLKERQRKEL